MERKRWFMNCGGDPVRYGDPSWATQAAAEQPVISPNRSARFPCEPGSDRGHPRPVAPDLPAGTRLVLRPDEWREREHPDQPTTRSLVAIVARVGVRVHLDAETAWVSVAAHGIECAWASAEFHRPCVGFLARVDVLEQAARR